MQNTKEARLAALHAVREQGMSSNDAARMFGVSRATLQRLLKSNADERSVLPKLGTPTLLPREFEEVLAKRILEERVDVAPALLDNYSRVLANHLNIPLLKRMAGHNWRRGFCKRWGISMLKAGQTTGACNRGSNWATMQNRIEGVTDAHVAAMVCGPESTMSNTCDARVRAGGGGEQGGEQRTCKGAQPHSRLQDCESEARYGTEVHASDAWAV